MIEFNATFIVAMFSFVVFIMIMNAIFYNPIFKIIETRKTYIRNNYNEASRFAVSAREKQVDYDAKIEETKAKCNHELKKEVEIVKKFAEKSILEARQQAKQVTQNQKDKLEHEGQELRNSLKDNVIRDLASVIISKFTGVEGVVSNFDPSVVDKVMK